MLTIRECQAPTDPVWVEHSSPSEGLTKPLPKRNRPARQKPSSERSQGAPTARLQNPPPSTGLQRAQRITHCAPSWPIHHVTPASDRLPLFFNCNATTCLSRGKIDNSTTRPLRSAPRSGSRSAPASRRAHALADQRFPPAAAIISDHQRSATPSIPPARVKHPRSFAPVRSYKKARDQTQRPSRLGPIRAGVRPVHRQTDST